MWGMIVLFVLVMCFGGCRDLPVSPLLASGDGVPVVIQKVTGPSGGKIKDASDLYVHLRCNEEPAKCHGVPMRVSFDTTCADSLLSWVYFVNLAEKEEREVEYAFTVPTRAKRVTVTLYKDTEAKTVMIESGYEVSWPGRRQIHFAYDRQHERLVWDTLGFHECQASGAWEGRRLRSGMEDVNAPGTYIISCIQGKEIESKTLVLR